MVSLFDPKPSAHRWSWVNLVGPDAQDFLHRITTVNVRNLSVGDGAPGCLLNPQGKIRSYFRLWNHRPTEYAFELDFGVTGHWKTELLATIDQFTFGEKIALTDTSDALDCLWIFAEPGGDSGLPVEPGHTAAIDEEIRLCHQGDRDYGRPWITAWGRSARLRQWAERALPSARRTTPEEIESWRIEALGPRVDAEITPATNPLEVGIPEAVAPNKGCYPGQEVIEKIAALGAPARRLARIEGSGEPPRPGDKLFNESETAAEVGEITSVAPSATGYSALALLRKIHAKEGLPVKLPTGAQGRVARVAPYA